jgi:sigma-B regulation protein RsbQ
MLRTIVALAAMCVLAPPIDAAQVEVEDLTVNYTANGTGPAIIFVHGWTCDETSWRLQAPAFSRDHRVITIDLPGHGRSEVPPLDRFSMNLFAASVEAVRAKERAQRVVLVGHSMGAVVIRQYALNYPEHVAGLVAVDGPLDVRRLAARSGIQPAMTLASRESMIKGMFVAGTSETLRAEILEVMLGTPEATATGSRNAMFDAAIQSDRRIPVPAMSIYAGTAQLAQQQSTKEMFPAWESTQIPETGHFLMMEKPEEFNRLLAGFLRDHAADVSPAPSPP